MPPPVDAGETALRLAVLLGAGVAPERAWAFVAEGEPRLAAVAGAGTEGAEAVRGLGGEWPAVATAWSVAAVVGAPLAPSLRAIAEAVREARDGNDDLAVALAEPAGTARLMAWLPLVGVVLGALLGFDVLGVLTTNPVGIACLVAGVLLILAARRWTGRLVRAARPPGGVAGLADELLAIALSGGVSLDRARVVVREAGGPEPAPASEQILTLSHATGAPAVELLRAAGALARHRARTEGRLRVARVSSRLLIPLGVCTLPAFLLLGVAPMLVTVLASTSLST
ncbi:pilus assembly protein TadB [Microbacterium sp. X-17]|uniref:pilus assembly protein TadB n=1 Tax=Microbacterium sp. X-17 TaxID=3144404 RepID=UPI0031F5410C